MADILVIDDDQSIAQAFERFLRHDGHEFRVASSAEAGLRLLAERVPMLVFMDVRMPGLDGLQALPMMRQKFPAADVVIMTAFGTSQTAIDAMRAGAFDLLAKPLDVDLLRSIISKVTRARAVRTKLSAVNDAGEPGASALVGESTEMRTVFKLIGRLATMDVPALVVGERGTGRRAIVSAIHSNSARHDQPLTVIDCSGPDASAELGSLLDGSLTGTVQLAAVEGLSSKDQGRLAVFVRGLASGSPARVMASTQQQLGGLVETGEFNRELLDALAVITLNLPPLRERRDDIPLLVEFLLRRLSADLGRVVRGIDADVARMFREHSWPGNVEELLNVLRRAAILSSTAIITADDVGDSLNANRQATRRTTDASLARAAREALRERLAAGDAVMDHSVYHDVVAVVEEALVQEALEMTSGNQVKASDLLGVNRTTLRKKAAGA